MHFRKDLQADKKMGGGNTFIIKYNDKDFNNYLEKKFIKDKNITMLSGKQVCTIADYVHNAFERSVPHNIAQADLYALLTDTYIMLLWEEMHLNPRLMKRINLMIGYDKIEFQNNHNNSVNKTWRGFVNLQGECILAVTNILYQHLNLMDSLKFYKSMNVFTKSIKEINNESLRRRQRFVRRWRPYSVLDPSTPDRMTFVDDENNKLMEIQLSEMVENSKKDSKYFALDKSLKCTVTPFLSSNYYRKYCQKINDT